LQLPEDVVGLLIAMIAPGHPPHATADGSGKANCDAEDEARHAPQRENAW
jgi:hypothetical protein